LLRSRRFTRSPRRRGRAVRPARSDRARQQALAYCPWLWPPISDEDIAQRRHCSFHCTGFCKHRQDFLCPNHKENYRLTAYCCSQLGSRSASVWEISFEPLPIEEHSLQ
jgi:hypothetical protein